MAPASAPIGYRPDLIVYIENDSGLTAQECCCYDGYRCNNVAMYFKINETLPKGNKMKPNPQTMQRIPNYEDQKRMLDYLKISYWLIDINNILLDLNQTFLDWTGGTRDNLVGRNALDLVTPQEAAYIINAARPLFEGQPTVQYELYIFDKNREKIPVLFHMTSNLDKNGELHSINVLMSDLTRQKENEFALEKEKRMLKAVLFGIRDCVSIFDKDGTFLLANPEAMKLRAGEKGMLIPHVAEGRKEISRNVEGGLRQYMGEVRPIMNTDGKLIARVEMLTDITTDIRLKKRERELDHFRRKIRKEQLQTQIIGSGKAMDSVFNAILKCAEVDSSVLITGETGVGKEVAARAIHSQSHRKDNNFVDVNCGALPKDLLESELFGHVKGAFTGAISDRPGLFREAEGGTLFLDEIGDLDQSLQVKLLRAVQDKQIRPVGDDRSYPADVRIICASNRNLRDVAENGGFRLDLYYRISVIPIHIPPLRERSEDIIKLSEYFVGKYLKEKEVTSISPQAKKVLSQYYWPGNIRELQNAIEHALVMSQDKMLLPESLPDYITENPSPRDSSIPEAKKNIKRRTKAVRREEERTAIIEALEKSGGNQTAAARELGISRVTLWRKRTMYNLDE